MRLWAYKQDNTVPGCGDPDCCDTWEDLEWNYHLSAEPLTAEQYQEEHGGGPVLEIRQATKKEARGYWAGFEQGTESGWANAELWLQKKQDREFQENMVMDEMTRHKLSQMQTRSCHESITEPSKELLDPATLTPESLYELQSQTWAQGSEYQRDLWLARLNRIRTWNPTSSADFHEGALHERMRIIDLIRDTYTDHDFHETGSFVYSEDIVELIEKDNK
jgi:hypothetical protein